MPARVERQHACAVRQPIRCLGPLAGVTGKAVKEKDGRTISAEVKACETRAFALKS